MKVRSIKNPSDFVNWDIRGSKWSMKSEAACRSKIQYSVGQQIKKRYPFDPILEDITIPETRLSLDFFLPQRSIAVEVQGAQHYKFNKFFHKNKNDLASQKKRDDDKKYFCEINSIKLIIISDVESLQKELS